jgi:hypothetical protein
MSWDPEIRTTVDRTPSPAIVAVSPAKLRKVMGLPTAPEREIVNGE